MSVESKIFGARRGAIEKHLNQKTPKIKNSLVRKPQNFFQYQFFFNMKVFFNLNFVKRQNFDSEFFLTPNLWTLKIFLLKMFKKYTKAFLNQKTF